ncbi:MAG: GspE/PulE family protein [Fimbriimonadales bacterium]|nr:GspE/PulE family protein [Fimbriimonadales bacterium]
MNLDKPLSDIFVEEGYITREELDRILAERTDTTESVGDLLVRLGIINEKQKLKCVGLQMGIPFVDLARIEINPNVARIIPHSVAIRLLVVPIEKSDYACSVAMVNPLDLAAIDEVAEITGLEVDPLLATEEDVRDAIFRTFGAYDDLGEVIGEAIRGVDPEELRVAASEGEEEEAVNVIELKEVVEGAPVIKLTNALLARAIGMRASDIHIEPLPRRVRVRFRIDGLLQEAMSIPKDLQYPLISRIKIMASMDIAERRSPQDGRCTMISPQGEFDLRVSTYPGVCGENIVIRLLDKRASFIDLHALGLSENAYKTLLRKIEEPQGLVLVTGPTGSGKTTTLYASLCHLNAIHRHIITIEDPVEYQLEGIVQANVNPKAGLTFASGLRSILRQDPDVIMVGEVRDRETAEIAVESALTGHLVLTSLHANDSTSAITRLVDIGVEPFLLAASISCSVAQRLVRTICPKCREAYAPPPELLRRLELPEEHEYFRGRGCEACAKTGFRGRVGIFEVLNVTQEIRRLIAAGKSPEDLRACARSTGMETLRDDARAKILAGTTTVEEVLRTTAESH